MNMLSFVCHFQIKSFRESVRASVHTEISNFTTMIVIYYATIQIRSTKYPLRFQSLSFLRYKQISIVLRSRTKHTNRGKGQKQSV